MENFTIEYVSEWEWSDCQLCKKNKRLFMCVHKKGFQGGMYICRECCFETMWERLLLQQLEKINKDRREEANSTKNG